MEKFLKKISIENLDGEFLYLICTHYKVTENLLTMCNCTIFGNPLNCNGTQEENIEEFNMVLSNIRAFSVDTLK